MTSRVPLTYSLVRMLEVSPLRLHLLLQFECSRRFVQAELTYGRHAGEPPFEKITPLLLPSTLTYRSSAAHVRHATQEKAIVLASGDHVGRDNRPARTRVSTPDPSVFAMAMELLG